MNITKLTNDFAVSPQIDYGDMEKLAKLGYSSVINCRPDGEDATQPLSKALLKAAKKAGLTYHYIPFKPGRATQDDHARFKAALEQSEGPVLAFCRSGMRAKSLYKKVNKSGGGFFKRLFGG